MPKGIPGSGKPKTPKTPVGLHPNSLKNLKPCKKGETANPKGRPPGRVYIMEALNKYLKENPHEIKAIVQGIVLELKKANAPVLKEILERNEGKVPQAVQHGGIEGGEIKIRVVEE